MPSDASTERALELLERSLEAHRSAVVSAAEEIRGLLEDGASEPERRAERLRDELGPFAGGRIDPVVLATLLPDVAPVGPEVRDVVERALEILEEASVPDADEHVLSLWEGADVRDEVRDRLGELGRVFGAARATQLARRGGYDPERHNALLAALPFRDWTYLERTVAPPLVVELGGGDLRPVGLAEFLDGTCRIVLLVRGAAPPAALARLIAPDVWVGQAHEIDAVAALEAREGPGILAVFDEESGAVPFVHDPLCGRSPSERLDLADGLDAARELLERSRWKDHTWSQDLAHLISLAGSTLAPAEASAPDAEATDAEPDRAERLAAWLLARSEAV